MMNFPFAPAALVIAISLTTGCSVYHDKRQTDRYVDDMGRSSNEQLSRSVDSVTLDAKRAAQDVSRPYITGKAIPLSREVTLPAPLRGMVDTTMLFKDEGDLTTIAQQIKQTTGIPVKVMPDALLPVEMFMPRLERATGGGGMVPPTPLAMSQAPVALSSPLPGAGFNPVIQTSSVGQVSQKALPPIHNGSQPLEAALDSISMRFSVSWKYDDQVGAIIFYRTETRNFEIRGAELAATSNMSLELSGGMDTSSTSGISSKSKSALDIESKKEGPMSGIVVRISQFMTRAGQIAVGSGGMVVVTDTKAVLDQIEGLVALENKMRTRRIDLVFEEITIEKTNSEQGSANWNLAFNGGTGNSVTSGGLNSLLEQEGAAASIGASVGSGPWRGSSIAIQALSKIGKVVDQRVNVFGSLNGQPATSGRPQRQKYIDKLEQTQSFSSTSSPTVSVTQAEEVSGRIITVIPYAYSDGDINLTVKYDNTPTPDFLRQDLPDGSYVQSPSSVGDVLLRTAMLRSGQPFVISAQSLNSVGYDQRRTDRNAPILFGGSDVTNKSDRVTVFVLTAMVREK